MPDAGAQLYRRNREIEARAFNRGVINCKAPPGGVPDRRRRVSVSGRVLNPVETPRGGRYLTPACDFNWTLPNSHCRVANLLAHGRATYRARACMQRRTCNDR